RALANETIEIHGDGHQTRCFCHVGDTIRALKSLMEAADHKGEIFNVGSQNRISVLDLADKIRALTGSASDVAFIPYDEVYGQGIEDMIHRIPSIDKVHGAIGWRPERSLDDILSDVVAHVHAEALCERDGAVHSSDCVYS